MTRRRARTVECPAFQAGDSRFNSDLRYQLAGVLADERLRVKEGDQDALDRALLLYGNAVVECAR